MFVTGILLTNSLHEVKPEVAVANPELQSFLIFHFHVLFFERKEWTTAENGFLLSNSTEVESHLNRKTIKTRALIARLVV